MGKKAHGFVLVRSENGDELTVYEAASKADEARIEAVLDILTARMDGTLSVWDIEEERMGDAARAFLRTLGLTVEAQKEA